MIISGMLQLMREDAGLGCPPASITMNACETLSAVLKHKKMNSQHLLIRSLIDEQERELKRAVTGRGKYWFRRELSFTLIQVDEMRKEFEHIHVMLTSLQSSVACQINGKLSTAAGQLVILFLLSFERGEYRGHC